MNLQLLYFPKIKMTMKKLLLFLMLPLFAMLLTQCANPGKTDDATQGDDLPQETEPSTTVNTGNLLDIYWKLSELNNISIAGYPAQNKTPYLMLKTDGNRAEGTGGCNSMGGTYALTGDNNISFSQLISTKMACADMMMETEFHAALEATKSYQTDGKVLTLLNERRIPVARFDASTPE